MRPALFVKVAGALAIACALGGSARAEKSGARPNVISLPGGPGTMSGLGEQFEPTLNTGSATYKVALDVPAGTKEISFAANDRLRIMAITAAREPNGVRPSRLLYASDLPDR